MKSNNPNMPRINIKDFQAIPNVGKVTAKEFLRLGLNKPMDLVGQNPYQLFDELCVLSQQQLDPCLLDVFISAVNFMEGGAPRKWWEFTQERKSKWNR
ncbi:MAG: helix-hairpin-helix domain-containing protein [Pseudomonadota bacterium]|nr:helix-hairpin-helix domain-containing protein [Pseudomonadota bacterium]